MGARGKLFLCSRVYDTEGTDQLFLDAMKENCVYQYDHCPEYAAILKNFGTKPEQLNKIEDLKKLPPMPTVYLKRHKPSTMPGKKAWFRTTSSGTRGLQSEVEFDFGAMMCDLAMALRTSWFYHLFSLRPTNYLMLGYQPHRGNHMGVMKSAFLSTLLAPAIHREYALKFRSGKYEVDMDGIIRALQRYSRSRHPVRIIGFPSYLHFLMEELARRKICLTLPEGSMVLLGGGWKQFYKQKVDKSQLYREVWEQLGIPEGQIREVFSVVEHPIIYWDCPAHHFHIPIYSRVIIRDINTLEPLPEGQVGLVNLMTPLLKSAPLLSIMTDDLGVLHGGGSCSCRCRAPWLEIIGRVGMVDIKTCAAGAEDRRREAGV